MATKSIINEVKKGKKCVIFPEGRLTVTGGLMKVYEGPGLICDKSEAKLIPIRIDGAMYTPFSRMRHKAKLKWFPKITITILPEREFDFPNGLSNRSKRQRIGLHLYKLMTEMIFEASDYQKKSIFSALSDAKKIHGRHKKICEDTYRREKSYQLIINKSFLLGNYCKKLTKRGERVAVFLPNSTGCLLSVLALLSHRRVPALLDTKLSSAKIMTALKAAGINKLITSKAFIAEAKLSSLLDDLAAEHIKIIHTEEFTPSLWQKGMSFLKGHGLSRAYKAKLASREALISFDFDKSDQPRLICLTHQHLIANCYQIMSIVDFNKHDVLFNPMPMAKPNHFVMGVLLPLLAGVKVFFYPQRKHSRIISELIYDTNSSLLIGDEALLAAIAKVAHPYDFYSLRYVFAMNTLVTEETMRAYGDNFGVRLFQTYSSATTATLVAMNTPMQYKRGSMGCLLPGIIMKKEKTLWVSGPNLAEPWVNTGDAINIDEYGYLSINQKCRVHHVHQKISS